MSTELKVYSVPFARLTAVYGCRDEQLRTTILDVHAHAIASFDKQTAANAAEELEGYPEMLSCAAAIGQIVAGENLNRELGAVYAFAYEMICDTLSSALAGHWAPIVGSGDFFERLDAWLNSCRAGITLVDLTCRGPVFTIPRPIAFPSLGYWTPEQVAHAAERLARCSRSWWPWSRPKPPQDLASDVADITRWLEVARKQTGDALIGVHIY